MCSSMEEQLRFNLDNFWEESSYREGNLTNLSLHHPLNILSALMCGCSLVFNIFFLSLRMDHQCQDIWLEVSNIFSWCPLAAGAFGILEDLHLSKTSKPESIR